jgi:hypothetical protein
MPRHAALGGEVLHVASTAQQMEEGIAAEIKKGVTITRNAFI